MFDLDDIIEVLESAGEAASNLAERAVEIAKEEAPHIAHKAGEVIEEIAKKIK